MPDIAQLLATRTCDRRSRLVTAAAIVVGLVFGVLTCAGIADPSTAQAHGTGSMPAAAAHSPSVPADSAHAHAAEGTGDGDTPVDHHASMACLVDITLQIADLDVVMTSEPNADPAACAAMSYAFGPEPPVPRPHS